MKTIPLTRGKVAIVDDEDYEMLSKFKWQARRSKNGNWYAQRGVVCAHCKCVHAVHMHHEVLQERINPWVDHKNGNGLDNRRENLRDANLSQNGANKSTPGSNSGYRGVYRQSRSKTYLAQIKTGGKVRYIGNFADPAEAARAWDKAAKKFHGEFARLNFPN